MINFFKLSLLAFTLFNSAASAGVLCGGEKVDTKKRMYLEVKTSDQLGEVISGNVTIVDANGETEKRIELEATEIAHYYESCIDADCNNVVIGVRAFKSRTYPFTVKFIGPDYSSGAIRPQTSVDAQLNKNREDIEILPNNIMTISKMINDNTLEGLNAKDSFEDVICVITPDISL